MSKNDVLITLIVLTAIVTAGFIHEYFDFRKVQDAKPTAVGYRFYCCVCQKRDVLQKSAPQLINQVDGDEVVADYACDDCLSKRGLNK